MVWEDTEQNKKEKRQRQKKEACSYEIGNHACNYLLEFREPRFGGDASVMVMLLFL
jgi:hypothetical protein